MMRFVGDAVCSVYRTAMWEEISLRAIRGVYIYERSIADLEKTRTECEVYCILRVYWAYTIGGRLAAVLTSQRPAASILRGNQATPPNLYGNERTLMTVSVIFRLDSWADATYSTCCIP